MLTSAHMNTALIIFSALSFLAYGSACCLSDQMRNEFDRSGLGAQRTLVGGLQWCAALGLVAGIDQPRMGRAASAGLSVMMLRAVCVRIRLRDSPPEATPALLYLALNVYLRVAAF